ncbi:MAG: division/cell wall cluster transcriptional repressor MraZ [Bacteroidota bacterium]
MAGFTGEFECTADTKCRVLFPIVLRKQLSPDAMERFVINRGFEKHLNLYPLNEWNIITAEMSKLNLFVKENRDFYRKFHNGATELFLDGQGRILFPRLLMNYAGIRKDAVLYAFANRIEVWSKHEFDKMIGDKKNYAALAEKVMGKLNKNG